MKDDAGDYLYYKNQENKARWYWKWVRYGGSFFTAARDLSDLRNAEDLRRGRAIEFKRRRINKKYRKIINLAAWRMERVRQTVTRKRAGAF